MMGNLVLQIQDLNKCVVRNCPIGLYLEDKDLLIQVHLSVFKFYMAKIWRKCQFTPPQLLKIVKYLLDMHES